MAAKKTQQSHIFSVEFEKADFFPQIFCRILRECLDTEKRQLIQFLSSEFSS